MRVNRTLLFLSALLAGLSLPGLAQLQDQGLNSVLQIIDKAVAELASGPTTDTDGAAEGSERSNAEATIVNLSRTLGTLSFSRLQCGQAEVLAEFTRRVQAAPETSRDAMRDAFQEGFDKSEKESKLLSEDECRRLTASREREEKAETANVKSEQKPQPKPAVEKAEPKAPQDPADRYVRIAELSGQLAYKREFCEGKKVFNRDYNQYIASVPEIHREKARDAYWKGYRHGKRLNRNLTKQQCS